MKLKKMIWIKFVFSMLKYLFLQDVAFRFEGVVGNGFAGDIAIDDVMILPGHCSKYFLQPFVQ